MPAGRPRKPIERQLADSRGDGQRPGGHRPAAELVHIPRGNAAVPDPPDGLKDRGELEWRKVWEAGAVWLHPASDYHWVEQIAFAYDNIEVMRTEVEKVGLIVKGYAGQQTANPLLHEISDQQATIRKCLSMLGFSPTDRAKLGLAELKVRTGLQDLQERQGKKK